MNSRKKELDIIYIKNLFKKIYFIFTKIRY